MKTPSSNNQRALEHPLLITSDYTDIGTTLFQNIQREAKKARCAFWYAIVLVCLNLLGWSNRGEAAPVTFYVADSSFGHLTGRPDEYGCWSANTDQDAAGYLVYGPYTTAVSPGVNAASFQLMIDNTTADNLVVATIDVFDATTGIQLASKDITRTEFASPYAYKSFTLNFTAQANHRMEFRTFWYDRAYMRQSSVDVTDTLYIYTLGGAYNSSGYDEAVAVASLQGVINRNSPTLYVKTAAAYLPPQYWLNKFSVPGGWLAGRTQVPCTDLNALVALAGTKVKEVVVWDPNVPATVNVATTIAGVRDAVVVSPDQLAQFPAHWGLPIFYDLRNKFTGSGTVNYDGVSFASTGSKKNDAYRWAIEKYLKTGLCSKTLLCYFEDSYFRASNGVCPNGVIDYAVTRDWAVKNRSFVYDLSPWGDVVPKDDPYQPLGTDLATYKLMLGALLNQTAGTIMTEICGFFSFTKYGSESPHGDVATEWETVHLISHYNAYQNTVADSCFNQSLHSQAPVSFPLSNTRPAVQLPLEHKSYICIFMGDYDSAAPLYETLPLGIGSGSIWDDPQRGSIPLVWGVNPNLINTYPDLIKYYYDTKSPNDYFAADASCAGYMNPSRIQEQYLPLFIAHNKSYYGKLDMTISPMVLDWEQPSSKVKDAFAQFSPDGYSTILWHHFNGYVQPVGEYVVPQVWNGMPILALQDVGPLQDVVPNPNFIDHLTNNLPPAISQPSFNIVRVTWETPSRVISAINKVKANRPDLNIEVVDPYNFFRLAKQTLPVPSADTLLPGQAMSLDSSIYSANGKFRLTYQSNGNVVIYRTADGFVKAQTGTDGHTPTWFGLQSDGNLVLYTEEAGAIFHTVTGEKGVTKAVLQNDGNLVLYAGNTPLWTSSIPINSGDHLYPGEAVYSPNCNYYFVHQDGGNVVIYRTSDWSWIWQSYTQGQTTTHAVLQGDGNLVLYNGGTVITSTQTTGKGAVTATMQDDGNFVLRKSDGTAVWSTQGGMVP